MGQIESFDLGWLENTCSAQSHIGGPFSIILHPKPLISYRKTCRKHGATVPGVPCFAAGATSMCGSRSGFRVRIYLFLMWDVVRFTVWGCRGFGVSQSGMQYSQFLNHKGPFRPSVPVQPQILNPKTQTPDPKP